MEVFSVTSGVTASLSGLTISGGSATQGGGIDNAGTLTITCSGFFGNSAIGAEAVGNGVGGNASGAAISNTGVLSITSSAFGGNLAIGGYGGEAPVQAVTAAGVRSLTPEYCRSPAPRSPPTKLRAAPAATTMVHTAAAAGRDLQYRSAVGRQLHVLRQRR